MYLICIRPCVAAAWLLLLLLLQLVLPSPPHNLSQDGACLYQDTHRERVERGTGEASARGAPKTDTLLTA